MSVGDVSRKLAAIFYADVAGYSRLTGADEVGTHRTLSEFLDVISGMIENDGGSVLHYAGDAILAEFASVVVAVECAVGVQTALATRSADTPEDQRLTFRIGINFGDVIADRGEIYGDGVNIAARLESLADPGGVCISAKVHDEISGKLDIAFEDIGAHEVKNIAGPIQAFHVRPKSSDVPATASPTPDKPSIAILPFDNMSSDPEQEFFADGMTEDLITAISKLRWFFVIARNSTFVYKNQSIDVREVARELGVRYVLEGSVRKAGASVRVNAQLIEAETGNHIWAEKYDRQLEDIFALQDEMTENIAAAIEPQLYKAEVSRARKSPTTNLDAWEQVVRAMSLMWRVNRDDFDEAGRYLDAAIQIDPEYGQAYSMRAFLNSWRAAFGSARNMAQILNEARDDANKALSLDDDDQWAHHGLGFVHMMARRSDEAMTALKRSLKINPNFAIGNVSLGCTLAYAGQSQEAYDAFEAALKLSPNDPFNNTIPAHYGVACFVDGKFDDAIDKARESINALPYFPLGYFLLAASCAMAGRESETVGAVEVVRSKYPRYDYDRHMKTIPFSPDTIHLWRDGLVKAGLGPDDQA